MDEDSAGAIIVFSFIIMFAIQLVAIMHDITHGIDWGLWALGIIQFIAVIVVVSFMGNNEVET